MAAGGKWKVYDAAKWRLAQGDLNLDGITFKCALFTSSSNADDLSHDNFSDLTNQVANGLGYTSGGIALTTTWSFLTTTSTFDSDDPSWVAAGGAIAAKYAVIYDTTGVSPLLCICKLHDSGVTVNSGEQLKIIIDSTGVFTLSGAITN